MTVEAVQGSPGLWRSGAPNTAGVHALIIGVSDYPFLSGGSAPNDARAPDNGGLGQLEVSAHSGALFFDWMVKAGEVAGATVASCRLHLAPRPDELPRVKDLTGGHYGSADYTTLRAALEGWSNELSVAGRTGVGTNVALFFYSGHGVEVAASPAVLASDILNQLTADQGASKAIAVDAMTTAIKTYNINRGLFFVDACRDAPMAARLINLVGDDPLKPNGQPVRRPDALIRLQSTASGLKSYQAKDEVGTLFTQAVLDGLKGPPPQFIPYDTTKVPWTLKFAALEGHVKRKVSALLADRSALAVQSVEPYGNPYNGDMIVAFKKGPQPDTGDVLPPPTVTAMQTLAEAVDRTAANILKNMKSLDSTRFYQLRAADPEPDLFNFSIMHEVLGHESATDPWIKALHFLDARTGESTDPSVARIFASRSQEIEGRIAAWIDLAIHPGGGEALWIGAGGDQNSAGYAVVIPRDLREATPVRLDVQFDASEGDWRLLKMSARLADPAGATEPMASGWATLFEAQRTEAFADLASAASAIAQLKDLQDVVSGKRDSPVAAAFATNLLLRANGIDYLEDWPRNLANWFDWLADGPVLWAETLLRQRNSDMIDLDDPGVREALTYYQKLADRGVPLLAHSLTLAIRQAELWRRFVDSNDLAPQEQSDLRAALEYVDRASHYAVSGIGFTRFVSADRAMDPHEVLGARPRPQARAAMAAA